MVVALIVLIAALSFGQTGVESRIKRVEEGLLPPVLLKAERGWSLKKRMEHHKIPGVSVAVINNHTVEWARAYGSKKRERMIR